MPFSSNYFGVGICQYNCNGVNYTEMKLGLAGLCTWGKN